ncbi:HGxxPAAW family protein [Propionibacteriaceae bacterium Y1923]|uniref:HGxxPAAW family protein n=1 Tax=Aestuariimicrobium sp. Y1814 TaxID=3418742 RepID=UPI003C1F634B
MTQQIEDHTHTIVKTKNGKTVKYYHHSQSPAIWTGVIMAMIGFVLAGVGAVLGPMWLLVYIGAGLIVAAFIVTWIMKAAGLGHG